MRILNPKECEIVTGGKLTAENTIGLGTGIVGVGAAVAGAAGGAMFFPFIAAAAGGYLIGKAIYDMATT